MDFQRSSEGSDVRSYIGVTKLWGRRRAVKESIVISEPPDGFTSVLWSNSESSDSITRYRIRRVFKYKRFYIKGLFHRFYRWPLGP